MKPPTRPSFSRIPFTPAAYQKMQQDLAALLVKEQEVIERLRVAREMGDLSENGAYRYAKFELGNVRRQIRQLRHLLGHGEVVHPRDPQSGIGFGNTVTVANLSAAGKHVTYILVSKHESDPRAGKLSMEGPLGQALLGKKAGEQIAVTVPTGVLRYEIVQVE